jgi:hypothetical protein
VLTIDAPKTSSVSARWIVSFLALRSTPGAALYSLVRTGRERGPAEAVVAPLERGLDLAPSIAQMGLDTVGIQLERADGPTAWDGDVEWISGLHPQTQRYYASGLYWLRALDPEVSTTRGLVAGRHST